MNYLKHIETRIEEWLDKAGPHHKWMSVNNSSWHMSVFPKFHSNIEEIHRQLKHEKEDPMSYSTTSVVWDIQANEAIYVWHEFDHLPASTSKDIRKLDEEIAKVKAAREEHQRKVREESRRIEEEIRITNERKQSLEDNYNEYIKKCINDEVQPVPFYQYEKS